MRENKNFSSQISERFVAISGLICAVLMVGGCSVGAGRIGSKRISETKAPFDMPEIREPIFPNRTIDIRDFGAVPGGIEKNTKAIAAGIAACAKAGGGTVLIPAGVWLTGPIHLKSNVNLHIVKGAELRFSTDFDDYLPVVFTRYEGLECYNYSPLIYARDCENVAVTGEGKLDGRCKALWDAREKYNSGTEKLYEMASKGVPVRDRIFGGEEYFLRPNFVEFVNCKGVLVEGLTIGSGPMWTLHPVYCRGVIVRGVTFINEGPNNDGIGPDSCNGVLIQDCGFDTNDDAIAIKSGRDADGWRVGRACENIIVRHCRFGLGKKCDGVVSIGSEMSGDVRNVFIHDCTFDGTVRGIRIKSKRGRGGIVENIWLKNITMGDVGSDALLLNMFYGSGVASASKKAPVFRNIYVENLSCKNTRAAIVIRGLPEKPIEDVTLENISIQAERGLRCSDARGLKVINVNINPQQEPVMLFRDCKDIVVRESTCPEGIATFIKLEGKKTEQVVLADNKVSAGQCEVVVGAEVQPGAVPSE